MPILVTTNKNGYKSMVYDKLTSLLVEGMKEQQKEIEELRALVYKQSDDNVSLVSADSESVSSVLSDEETIEKLNTVDVNAKRITMIEDAITEMINKMNEHTVQVQALATAITTRR